MRAALQQQQQLRPGGPRYNLSHGRQPPAVAPAGAPVPGGYGGDTTLACFDAVSGERLIYSLRCAGHAEEHLMQLTNDHRDRHRKSFLLVVIKLHNSSTSG
ncbi:unnamed protein product [Lota lota]